MILFGKNRLWQKKFSKILAISILGALIPMSGVGAQEVFQDLSSKTEKLAGDRFFANDFNEIIWILKSVFLGSGPDGVFGTSDDRIGIGENPSPGLKLDVTGKIGAEAYCDEDGNNCFTPDSVGSGATSGSGSGGVFVGKSTVGHVGELTFPGGILGYDAANKICDADFTGSHFCTQAEMILSVNSVDISGWTGSVWIAAGGAKYSPAPVPVNDCNGWKQGVAGSYLGNFWMMDANGGKGGVGHCANLLPLACCK
jgi:hypothetical protein